LISGSGGFFFCENLIAFSGARDKEPLPLSLSPSSSPFLFIFAFSFLFVFAPRKRKWRARIGRKEETFCCEEETGEREKNCGGAATSV
jgi:hypothetical protein